MAEKYIILYGRSLGLGFAAKLASMNHSRMLILDAPYWPKKVNLDHVAHDAQKRPMRRGHYWAYITR